MDNFYTICEGDKKLPYLIQFVSNHQSDKFIIYFLTCACVNYFYQVTLSKEFFIFVNDFQRRFLDLVLHSKKMYFHCMENSQQIKELVII